MRISDWSSDVCSSDLTYRNLQVGRVKDGGGPRVGIDFGQAGHNELSLLSSGDGGRLSQMRISRNRRLQSPLVAAVDAIPARLIASHPPGLRQADVGGCRLRGAARPLQGLWSCGRPPL